MKKVLNISNASPAKLALIVIALYSVIGTITYFSW